MKHALHYVHERHVIGDVHPFRFNGRWYVYYLMPGGNYESALLVSDDLLTWRESELKHEGPRAERPYFALGVFRTPDGVFRSYHGSADGVMKAQESTDLLSWRNSEANRDIPPQPSLFESRRDPFVLWNESDGRYWCVMTAKTRSGATGANGAVAYATSPDLTNWTLHGSLYDPGTIGEPECPQLFRMGATWYLLASIYDPKTGVGKPSYWMSSDPRGPWETPRPDALDGADLRAAQVAIDGSRWILLGWIRSNDAQWGGCIGLPREVYRLADGTLATRLESTAASSVRGELLYSLAESNDPVLHLSGWRKIGRELVSLGLAHALLDARIERFDLDAIVTVDATVGIVGVRLSSGGKGEAQIAVEGDDSGRTLLIQTDIEQPVAAIRLRVDEPLEYRLRVILDDDVVEVFLNDRYSLAGRLPAAPVSTLVGIVTDLSAHVRELSIYAIKDLQGSTAT